MDVLRTPVLHGSRVTLRPPAAEDADAARRIGLHPEILRMFGEEAGDGWRELTPEESEELLEALASTADRVTWVVRARASSAPRRSTVTAATERRRPTP